jgi:hypothetical protein
VAAVYGFKYYRDAWAALRNYFVVSSRVKVRDVLETPPAGSLP